LARGKRYNNGIISKYFKDNEPIPEGWTRGYAPKEKEAMLAKYQKTNLERYGVANPFQSKEVKEKSKQTNLKKYGTEYATQSSIVQEKTKQTNIKKYGTEYSFQSDEVKDKIKSSMVSNYGVEHALQSPEVLSKMKENNIEKYGVDNVKKLEEVKEKERQTSLDRYGVEYYTQSKEYSERIKETNLEKYGVEYTFQSETVKEKKKETYKKHYGVDHPSKAQEIKDKKKQTSLKHFGTEYPIQSEIVKEKIRVNNKKKYGVEHTLQYPEIKERIKQTNLDKYGVPWACMRPEAKLGYSNDSKPNQEFAKLLEERGIPYEREFHLQRYSFDFKIGNTLIEINPSITHNSLYNPFDDTGGLDKNYHKNKSELAESLGYRVIHVFDWDDINKILLVITNKDLLQARKCKIKEVSKEECDNFLNKYHLQGTCKGQYIRIGLYNNDNIVSIMSFGKPRYNKKFEYELLRYCSICNITGGSEKIFKYFVKNYNPKSIISYCDRSKFTGEVYLKLKFKEKLGTEASKHWFSIKDKKHYTDNFIRQHGFDQIFGTDYGKGTSNEELLIKEGFVPVYDCGQATYTWEY